MVKRNIFMFKFMSLLNRNFAKRIYSAVDHEASSKSDHLARRGQWNFAICIIRRMRCESETEGKQCRRICILHEVFICHRKSTGDDNNLNDFLNLNHENNFVELDSIPISFRCFAVKIRASETGTGLQNILNWRRIVWYMVGLVWPGFGHSIQGKAILLL